MVDPHPPAESLLADDYYPRHSALVKDVLSEPAMMALFKNGKRLPAGYGVGWDERVVEFPWLLVQEPRRPAARRRLDPQPPPHRRAMSGAGRLDDDHDDRTPEPTTFTDSGVSYVYSDLRELPFRDGWFDTVVCASTIEHVGMDGSIYGDRAAARRRSRRPSSDARLRS